MSDTDDTRETGTQLPAAVPSEPPTWSAAALAAIEAVVLEVPGVADLFRARPTVQSAVTAIRFGVTPTVSRLVLDGAVLRIVIGTDGFAPAPAVARAVHDAALDEAARHRLVLSRVDVRIARIG
ncbi:hypothetical protein [Curtobacterium sp. SL109]|uniref:hypothetical protein n=1 Tax=Curtobacterium sp. SL109 TaxID=2994662 RepID=UPI0022737625|nr:hypothetical protein [Curtobacterium sp. SL109]MCY1696106.1 hypothetical protein [Curtobacterium sp. SL109]